ncbi:MAG: hypothetical protein OES14_06170 [Nitrosopumilus sp.]|nr:hypothetical protein [Nitrosopumilus sp.]MDH3825360.1 hypothetical protein [Nitrosopumilus sp.]
MKTILLILGIFAGIIILPNVSAEPSAQIIMEQTTFSYGQKLVYTIEVSEITGDLAIIHIRDESGKGSSAIPIEISQLKTEIPSPFPFDKQVFPEGKYFIDLQYSGAEYTAEFNLIDSGNIVIPHFTKQIAASWINNEVGGGIFIDAIQKTVETDAINIPYTIDREHLEKIQIPEWVKIITVWWLEEKISDETFANAFQNLIDRKIITV